MAEVASLPGAVTWPALIAGVLFWLRRDIRRFIATVVIRVEHGDSLEAGTSGLKLTPIPPQRAPAEVSDAHAGSSSKTVPAFDHSLYLLHRARRDAKLDKGELEYYRLRIWLEGDDSEEVASVTKVTYHLHPGFDNPERVVTDPAAGFALLPGVRFSCGQP